MENTAKRIVIFDKGYNFISTEGSLQTQRLERHLTKYFKEHHLNFFVNVYDLNEVDKEAQSADIIMLTPNLSYAKEDLNKRFPDISVIELSKREYGILDIENIYQKIAD